MKDLQSSQSQLITSTQHQAYDKLLRLLLTQDKKLKTI